MNNKPHVFCDVCFNETDDVEVCVKCEKLVCKKCRTVDENNNVICNECVEGEGNDEGNGESQT